MEIIEKRKQIRAKIIKEAKEWAESLKGKYTAILIGSYAKGDFNIWSDVDIVLISDFKGNPLERLKSIDMPAGYEIIPLTFEEFMRLLSKKDPIAKDAIKYKLILRDDFKIIDILTSEEEK